MWGRTLDATLHLPKPNPLPLNRLLQSVQKTVEPLSVKNRESNPWAKVRVGDAPVVDERQDANKGNRKNSCCTIA